MRHAMTCIAVLLSAQVFCAVKGKTVEYPLAEMSNTSSVYISKVELTKETTILYMDAYSRPHSCIRISADSYLKADGRKYMLTGAEGIQPDSLLWMSGAGTANFALCFEPMPVNTQMFDFIESDCEDCFKLYGIDLTGKKTFDKPDDVPESVANVTVPDAVPAPIFECGKTTVRLHFLQYRPEYNISSANLYVNNILGKQEELEIKIDPKSGEGELTFQQYGTALAFVVVDNSGYCDVWLAPGETIDLYVDSRSWHYWSYVNYKSGNIFMQQCSPSFQRLYTSGKYAGLNKFINRQDYRPCYSLNLLTGDFADYRMTSEEYADHVINTYKSLADSVSRNCRSQLDKEYQTLRLRQEACIAMAQDFREHNYRSVHKSWGSKIPADSIAPLRAEDVQRVCRLFDVNDTKLLMGSEILSFANAVYYPRTEWISKDCLQHGLLKDLRQVAGYEDKAVNVQLSDSDFAGLKAMDTPFFYNVFSQIQADAKRILETSNGKVEPVPDVAVEHLFDAIIAPYKGKVILVDFWNTWCGPCREAIKHNEPLKQSELNNDSLVWIYIANESSPVSTYMNMIPCIKGLHYRLNNEQWNYITGKFGIDGIPSYVLVDKSGHYSLRNDLRNGNQLRQTLQKTLAE